MTATHSATTMKNSSRTGGLAPALIPKISYPVFWVGGLVTFDVAMHYDDDFGHLGDRTLHFAPAPGSPGLFGTATGPSALALPPLAGGYHVVVSGSFKLTADAAGGPSTEIKVFGTPEPGAAGLLALSGGLLLARRRRR